MQFLVHWLRRGMHEFDTGKAKVKDYVKNTEAETKFILRSS